MKKNLLKSLLCLSAIAAITPHYAAIAQNAKGLTRSIIINNGDTTVNGRKFSDLSKDERAKLRQEFKEMEKNFRGGQGMQEERNVIVKRRQGGDTEDVVISREGKQPTVLYWNDAIVTNGRRLENELGDIRILRKDGDSLFNKKEFRVFQFDGDSIRFRFNGDSSLRAYNFNVDGLDSTIRKRIMNMHGGMLSPGRPGTMAPPRIIERGGFEPFINRNNSSSFNYNHTDKDGITSRMNIRISDAGKDQLKKITGNELVSKQLEVNDLTLFPNFSSGNMTLAFSLAVRGSAKVTLFDSELKQIFTDDITGTSNYMKQLSLPKNGVYFLAISQNGSWFVRRVVKE